MKKNIFKKFGGAFLGLALGLGVVAGVSSASKASEVKADSVSDFVSLAKGKGTSGTGSAFTVTSAGISFDFDKAYGSAGTQIRSYAGGNCVVSYGTSITVSKIVFTWGDGKNGGTWTGGTLNGSDITWSSVASGSSISNSAQARITAISVDYTSSGTPTTNYTVTFDVQGHGTAPQAATVASGGKVTKPADPSESGYTFGGWYKETGCTNAWVFETDTVLKDTTIYAKWTENGGPTPPTPSGSSYQKVTSNLSDWSGQYLVVYESESTAYCWTGIDAAKCNFTATINDGVISAPSDAITYTIASMTEGYSIKVNGGTNNGKYTSGTSGSNKVNFGETAQLNTISYSSDTGVVITSNGSVLRFNNGLSDMRFRYYKNGGAVTNSIHEIQLYKLIEEEPEEIDLTDIGLVATSEVIVGSTVDLAPIKTPANANNKTTLTWESLNPAVATVSNGKVTGVTVGTAQIRVNATDIGKSAVCTVTVNPVPPVPVTHTIADCYSVSIGTNVKFNGVYMGTYGTNPYQGIFFADGEYGILIYGTSSVPSTWEVGKTVVAVSGKTAFYNGLVQVTGASFEVTSATVADPVPYTFLGTETTGNALSRKSSISGTITAITGQTSNAFVTGTDGKVTVDLGDGKTAMIFIKNKVHTAQELAEYTEKFTVGAYVVVTGFLNYYNSSTTFKGAYEPGSFQISVPTIVSTEIYDADAFAADFLSDTDAICSIVKEDHSTELQAAWSDIGAKFTALNDTEKAKVSAAVAGEDNDLSKAVERYDYLVAKYALPNFISDRPALPARTIGYVNHDNNSSTTIIIVVSVVSLTTLAALLVIKRRKAIEK